MKKNPKLCIHSYTVCDVQRQMVLRIGLKITEKRIDASKKTLTKVLMKESKANRKVAKTHNPKM